MAFNYSTASWRWYVMKDGKVASEFYASKIEADKKAAEIGGTVKKTRW
jgi:hypothetical protein